MDSYGMSNKKELGFFYCTRIILDRILDSFFDLQISPLLENVLGQKRRKLFYLE